MTDIVTPTLIVAIVVAAAIGGGIGAWLMWLMHRSQSGGKSIADLRQEQADYQRDVEQHFERTAELFKDMSENYRNLYQHLASGAQKLCQGEPVIQPLEFAKGEALTDQSGAAPTETPAPARPETGSGQAPKGDAAPGGPPAAAKPDTDAATKQVSPESPTPQAATPGTKTKPPGSSPQDVLKTSKKAGKAEQS